MLMRRSTTRFPAPALSRWALAIFLALLGPRAFADGLEDARKLLLIGNYQSCLAACEKISKDDDHEEDWRLLQTRVLLTVMGGEETYRAKDFTAGTGPAKRP